MNAFLEEIPGLPPQREIGFSIEIVPRFAPVSKIPYRMSILDLAELKIQLHQTQCISLGRTSFIC